MRHELLEYFLTFPPEHTPHRALDFGVDPEDQDHGEEASHGGRSGEQAATGGRGVGQGLFDRRSVQAAGDQRADILPVAA